MSPTVEALQAELDRVLAHTATLHPKHAPTPPPGATAGVCSGCDAPRGYHAIWCAQRGATDREIATLRAERRHEVVIATTESL